MANKNTKVYTIDDVVDLHTKAYFKNFGEDAVPEFHYTPIHLSLHHGGRYNLKKLRLLESNETHDIYYLRPGNQYYSVGVAVLKENKKQFDCKVTYLSRLR